MYLEYYRLKIKPFDINPDPKFLWLGDNHRKALSSLENDVLQGKSMMVLMGEPGTGKTTLMNALCKKLDQHIQCAQIPDPSLREDEFYPVAADCFGIKDKIRTKSDFFSAMDQLLKDASGQKKKIVLIIEEAQRLNPDLLEPIYGLCEPGGSKKPKMTVIFVGQNEFHQILSQNHRLGQRIETPCKLAPLQESEIEQYIKHRLLVAGLSETVFHAKTIREIYAFSQGIPRMINSICDLGLSSGFRKQQKIITAQTIRACSATYHSQSDTDPLQPERSNRVYRVFAPAALALLLLIFGYWYYAGDQDGPSVDGNINGARHPGGSLKMVPQTVPSQPSEAVQAAEGPAGVDRRPQGSTSLIEPDELAAVIEDLKRAKDRIDELEIASMKRDQDVSQTKQALTALQKELAREKNNNARLQRELNEKTSVIAELQRIRDQLERPSIEPSIETAIEPLEKTQPGPQVSPTDSQQAAGTETEPPDPNAIIDWIIQRKSD